MVWRPRSKLRCTTRRMAMEGLDRSSSITTPPISCAMSVSCAPDYYQIPYDPNPNDWENQLYDSSGLRDGQHETDGHAAFSWIHTFNPASLFEISPFYHYNNADYSPMPTICLRPREPGRSASTPVAQAYYSTTGHRNSLRPDFTVTDNTRTTSSASLSTMAAHPISLPNIRGCRRSGGGLCRGQLPADLVADSDRRVRQTHFQAAIAENAIYPRIGVAVLIPRLGWVLRGFYGHFYQPPPLTSLSGPALEYAQGNDTSFVPLRGERDEEHQFGLQIPWRGWLLDADTFQTRANNFLDHSNIGESSIFIPVTVDGALIQGWELTMRSPRLALWSSASRLFQPDRTAAGAITGGLICYPPDSPPAPCRPAIRRLTTISAIP